MIFPPNTVIVKITTCDRQIPLPWSRICQYKNCVKSKLVLPFELNPNFRTDGRLQKSSHQKFQMLFSAVKVFRGAKMSKSETGPNC